jgi:hypothetical protein
LRWCHAQRFCKTRLVITTKCVCSVVYICIPIHPMSWGRRDRMVVGLTTIFMWGVLNTILCDEVLRDLFSPSIKLSDIK